MHFKYNLAHKLVFQKIQKVLGGRMRLFVSGGAPLSQEIIEFFASLGVVVFEGYGMTETTVLASINTFEEYRFGTVGKPIPGTEIKLTAESEILIKGPGVFSGYYKDSENTAKTLKDGWLYSGDIGKIDKDGFLKITDRIKNIVITSGGKNITPSNIENLIISDPLFNQIMVYGDNKPFLIALITLNRDILRKQLAGKNKKYQEAIPLDQQQEVRELVEEKIAAKNKELPGYESIKGFAILEEDFTQEKGELTPTLKTKRRVITEHYREIIEECYESLHRGKQAKDRKASRFDGIAREI